MIVEPNCFKRKCRHFMGIVSDGKGGDERPVCRAFPHCIPYEIAYGPNLHTRPYPGDHGIQFQPSTSGDPNNET
jgi:hypothetical protein